MEEGMKESTKMIRNMALEFIHGLILENIKAGGLRVNSMA